MARIGQTGRAAQHHTDAAPTKVPRPKSGRARLTVRGLQLDIEPHLQILGQHR